MTSDPMTYVGVLALSIWRSYMIVLYVLKQFDENCDLTLMTSIGPLLNSDPMTYVRGMDMFFYANAYMSHLII